MNIRKHTGKALSEKNIWVVKRIPEKFIKPFLQFIEVECSLWSCIFCLVVLMNTGCSTSFKYSYESNEGPVYTGDYRTVNYSVDTSSTIKVISYNIEFANNFNEAIELLNTKPLSSFDVLLLQEMDEVSTDSIARALGCTYVYYPSINHPGQRKMVGNAILSKWKIMSHYKVKLPHPSIYPVLKDMRIYKFRKLATVAIINVNGDPIKFYSMHGAAFNTSKARKNIAAAIADDVNIYDTKVIVGGDFNTVGYGDIQSTLQPFLNKGFKWASEDVGKTIHHRRWMVSFFKDKAFQADHLFIRGYEVVQCGKIVNRNISDHYPIWVELKHSD